MKKIQYIVLVLGLLLQVSLKAQDTLRLEQAVEIALKNNYNIKIAKNNTQILQNSATQGNAGKLPTITTSANANYANNNIKLKIAGNPDVINIAQNGAATWTTGAAINLNYTLYDGFASNRTYERLKLNAEASQVQIRQLIENTVINVASQYYSLVTLTETYLIQLENVAISQERLERAKTRSEFGVNNQLAVLNAQVDLNTDSVSLVGTQLNIENAKRSFNQLLARSINTAFEVSTVVNYERNWNVATLKEEAKNQNAAIQSAKYNQNLAELDLKIAEAARSPRIGLTAGYSFSRQDNEVGLLLVNQNLGFSTGINLSFDIFNGGRKNLQIQNSKIIIDSRRQELADISLQLEQQVENAYATFQNRLFVLQMEERNLATARANFERTQAQANYGQVSNTQFREAQLNLAQSQNRLNNAKYAAKLAELDLQYLSGQIIENP